MRILCSQQVHTMVLQWCSQIPHYLRWYISCSAQFWRGCKEETEMVRSLTVFSSQSIISGQTAVSKHWKRKRPLVLEAATVRRVARKKNKNQTEQQTNPPKTNKQKATHQNQPATHKNHKTTKDKNQEQQQKTSNNSIIFNLMVWLWKIWS